MAPKKKPAKKKIKSTNGCLIITILLTILVVISLAATFYFLFLRTVPTAVGPTTVSKPQAVKVPGPPSSTTPPPAKAVRPPPAPAPAAPPSAAAPDVTPKPPPPSRTNPRIAIIIDDIGNTKPIAEQLIALELPLAFSILVNSPHANHLATLAKARGRDILLHLPMEASDPRWVPGPGTLLLAMSPDELIATIVHDLDVPYRPLGINNHMGSKFTEDPGAMRVFLDTIKPRGLFFIDSLTATNSVGYTLARELGIKTAKRDVFLDNEQDQTKILAQIGKVIALAHRHGSAIGIGHPYPATLGALRAAQTRLNQDITMVPVHELVE